MQDHTLIADRAGVTVRRVVVSAMENNTYLVTNRRDGSQLLIDAAAEPDTIAGLLALAARDASAPTNLRMILTTHAHRDHLGALGALSRAHPDAVTLAGEADADVITGQTGVVIDRRLTHGDQLDLGGLRLTTVALRGHTPGSVALVYAEAGRPSLLFSGDSLFPGGVGRTQRGQDFELLFGDVVERIFEVYPDETAILPGHGLPTTLGRERPHLAEWAARGW